MASWKKVTVKNKAELALASILFLGVAALTLPQILAASSLTRMDVALLNSIQLLFALGFGWVATRLVTFGQYEQAQRKFALGAFRRIREIQGSLQRLQGYIKRVEADLGSANAVPLQVLEEALRTAQLAVHSSIADWADIIGDEIQITNELARLRRLREALASPQFAGDAPNAKEDHQLARVDAEIYRLRQQLPPSLREVGDALETSERIRRGLDAIFQELRHHGMIVLDAFWEGRDTLTSNLEGLGEGDSLELARGLTQKRPVSYMVFRENGASVGIVTNNLHCVASYDEFCEVLDLYFGQRPVPRVLGGKPVGVRVLSISSAKGPHDRHYFRVGFSDPPSEEAARFMMPMLDDEEPPDDEVDANA